MRGPWSLEDVLMDMMDTQQGCQTILQHGIKVHERYRDLLRYLLGRWTVYEWKLPPWFDKAIKLIPKLESFQTMRKYHIFHDCGKPYAIRYDVGGHVSYPEHERVSKEVAAKLKFDEKTKTLIEMDMFCHRSDADTFKKELKNPLLPSLLFTALAEVYANGELFGGFDTDSFKMKQKKILSRFKQLLD